MDDLMKMEPDSDPLDIQTSDNADAEEGKLLSEEGNLLDFHFTAIKEECIDHRYDVKSEMTSEEVEVSVDFPIVKSEAEENSCELDEVSDEGKPEVTEEENEVLTESVAVSGNNEVAKFCEHIPEEDDGKKDDCDVCGMSLLDFAGLKGHYLEHKCHKDFNCDAYGKDVDLEVEEAWEQGCASLVPDKSRARYERAYNTFTNWLEGKKREINEKTMLAYFVKRTTTLKSASSLWSEYSMLKTMINLKYGINIGQFSILVNFLKKKNVGQMPKKSKVFDREDMIRFLMEAPDDTYLMMKVVMIMGIAGACRRDEITNLTIDDIEDRGSVVVVNIPNTKTKISRTFTIIDNPDEEVHFLDIFRKYVNLRPINAASRRFFHRFSNGKCTNQVVGMNSIGRVPSNIAKFLNLNDPDSYTGRAFRRTSATLLANTGADILALKRHGGWKSSTVTERYV
ncbi:uncharacterized protein [Periplaneta americana]|uniref:uncharacterized protein isoform X2 n=1 Tax=Periplaneta americana TaxID=6978 RepID=UPI0037E91458